MEPWTFSKNDGIEDSDKTGKVRYSAVFPFFSSFPLVHVLTFSLPFSFHEHTALPLCPGGGLRAHRLP